MGPSISATPASSGRGGSAAAFATLRLPSGEVQCWCASLDVPPEISACLYATLTPDERRRSARFYFERDRQRFIVAHGVLRDVLAHYLGTRAGNIGYVYNAFGKPDLNPAFGGRLRFSLSHSGDLAVIAVATSNVGVDVEYIRAESDYAAVANGFFSEAEVNYLTALPSSLHAEAFFSCWTKKEAYVKASGEGLAIPLNSFSVPLTTGPAPVLRDSCIDTESARHWSLFTLQLAPGYAGALAIQGDGWTIRQCLWKSPRE